MRKNMDDVLNSVTCYSIFSLALFSFTSTSLSSLSHILIFIPGLYFTYVTFRNDRNQIPLSVFALLGLVLISGISIIIAADIHNKLSQFLKLKYLLLGALSVFAYRNALSDGKNVKIIKLSLTIFLVAISLASISGAVGLCTGFNPLRFKAASEEFRSTGMYGMAITYGYGIGMVSVLLTGLVIMRDMVKEFVNYRLLVIAWIISLVGMYLSYTRGAIIAFVVSLPFFFYKKSKKIFYSTTVVGFLGILIVVGLIATKTFSYTNGDSRIFQSLTSDSNMIRVSQYKAAVYGFLEHPLFGLGYRNFEPHSVAIKLKYDLPFKDFGGHAHNNFLEFLAGTGLLGFIFVMAFFVLWIYEIYKSNNQFAPVFLALAVAIVIAGQFQCTMMDGENMHVIMFAYAFFQAFNLRDLKKRSV